MRAFRSFLGGSGRRLFGAISALGLALAAPVEASTLDPSGNLDTAFATTGKAQFNYKTVTVASDARAIIQQAGGKVVIGGGSNNGVFKDYLVFRMNPNGTLDPSFGAASFGLAGVTIVDMSFDDHINALAQNSDGSRFCGGGISNWDFGVACFTHDGILDTNFNKNGASPGTFKSNAPGSGGGGRILGMMFDRSDRLVAIGYAPGPSTRDVFLHRFNTDGTDDNSFGTNGWVRIDVNGGSDRGFDVAVLKGATVATDQLVAVGTNGTSPFIAILNANGSLDTSSHTLTSTSGIFNPAVKPQGQSIFEGVAVDSSKNIYVTGQGPSGGFYVEKYDLGHAAATAQTSNLGTTGGDVGFRVRVATVSGNERVYASGTNNNGTDFQVARFKLDLTNEFDTTTSLSSGSDFAYDVAVDQTTGYITATGSTFNDLNTVGVTRYEPVNGNLDTGFNGTGKYYAAIQGGSGDFAAAFAVQTDGNAILAGTTFTANGDYDLLVARVKTDGTRDTSWANATGGWDQRGFSAGSAEQMYAGGVAIDSTGKAVVVGTSNGYFAVRYNTNGTLDTSFNPSGSVPGTLLGNWGTNSEGKIVALDSNNNVIVGGDISSGGGFRFSRLAASNGALDTTFTTPGSTAGTAAVSFGTTDELKAMAIDPSGKIVAAGECVSGGFFKMCLARLNSNGTLDTTFNGTGKQFLTGVGVAADTFDIRSLQLLPDLDTASATDYKIVVAGQYVQSSPSQAMWLAARFNMDGSLDTSFNGTGYHTLAPGFDTTTSKPYVGSANSVALQYDEKLIIVGESAQPDPLNACCVLERLITVARLNWDGSLDTTYGSSSANPGFTYTSFGSDPSEAYQAYVYPQTNSTLKGRALLAPFIVASDFAMARYQADPALVGTSAAPVLDPASDLGRSNTDKITKDGTPTFTGTCSQGETVYLLVDGVNTLPRTRQICPAPLVVGGQSTYTLTPTLSGSPRKTYSISTITASGVGDTGLSPSPSLSVTIDTEINPAVTITSPTAGSNQLPNVSVIGTSEAVAAIVVTTNNPKGGGCAAGLVTADGNADGSGTGNWTCSNTGFTQGPHTITVKQTDLAGNADNVGVTRSFSVKVPTTTGIVSSVNPSKYGQPVTFTATVTPGANADLSLNGTNVRFVEGATTLATVALTASGVGQAGTATFTPSGLGLSAATHTIQAVYDENANWLASSASVDQVVQKADTATALTSSVNPTVFGQSTTFTATVTSVAPGAGVPPGTVTFLDGGVSIGTGSLNGSGVATFSTTALGVGNHTITASYGATSNYNGSTGSLTGNPQVVNKANTVTVVTSSPNPSILSQSVTFTATVSAVSPGAGTPSGTVTFLDGGNSIGTGTLNGSGVATFTTSALAVGNHTITTSYTGDGNFNGSTGSLTGNPQVVNKKPTTTALISAPKPSVFGQSVTFTATVAVTSPYTGTPTGTVTFLDAGNSIGTGTLNGSGVATFSTSGLSVGTHTITASYGADGNFDVSTGTLSGGQSVGKANTNTALVSSINPSVFGQSVTFTATISATAPGAGTPTGIVTFLDGGSSIGTGTLSGGVATFTASALIVGNHTITTTYPGDGSFNGSGGSLTGNPQVVSKADTTSAVTSSANPSLLGQSVTFTATISPVAPGGGTPTGTVTFLDNNVSIGTGTLSGGVATFTTSALALGNHPITTTYAGDANVNGSGATLTGDPQVVNKADTTIVVTSSVNPSVFGQSIAFTATISPISPGSGTPTGTVTFLDNNVAVGTGTLVAGVATLTTSALAVGSHPTTATYPGDGNFNGSSGTLTGDPQVVNKAGTTTSVTSSQNPQMVGLPVTFTATISAAAPGAGTPTGSVTFLDGGKSIGSGNLSGGVATFTTSSLKPGSRTITTAYAGDANFNGSTGSLTGNPQVMTQASTAITINSSQPTIMLGDNVTFTAIVTTPAGTAPGIVTFFDGNTPIGDGVLATVGANDQATFTTSLLSAAGSPHSITATYQGATSFAISTSAPISETVNPRATTIGVVVNPTTVVVGQSSTSTVTVTDSGSVPPGTADTFATTGAPAIGRTGFTATLFGGGLVLVAGGTDASNAVLGSAQIYSETGSGFGLAGNLTTARTGAVAVLLPNGEVLVAGGSSDGTANGALNTAELFDPAAGTFTPTSTTMTAARLGASAVLLNSGKVLLAGGANSGGALNSAELYDPVTDTFASSGNLNAARTGASATLLESGKVLIAGGSSDGTVNGALNSAEVFDPAGNAGAGTFASVAGATPTLGDNRWQPEAALLLGGDVLIAGGMNSSGALASADRYDPVTDSFTTSGEQMAQSRAGGAAVALPNGMVLLAGGTTSQVVDIYDENSDQFNVTGSLQHSDNGAQSVLLNNGQVLLIGLTSGGSPAADAQLYSPSFNPLGTVAVTSSEGTDVSGPCVLSPSTDIVSTCTTNITPVNVGASPHTITGTYAADAVHTGSSNTASLAVNQAGTTTAVVSSVNPSVFGQAITFTATVSPVSPSTGTPTGTVSFFDIGGPIGSGTLSGGVATFTTSTLGVGNHTISAQYVSDGNFTMSSGAMASLQVVHPASTTTAVTSSQNPSAFGQSVTFTATVTVVAPGVGTPTGTVAFLDNGTPIDDCLAANGEPLSGGMASCTTAALASGNHTITTSYTSDDGHFGTSTGLLTGDPQVVNKSDSTTNVTSSLNPSVFGQAVTFTATISAVAPGIGTPTGTVTFNDGGSAIGSGTLSGGVATFTTSALNAGSHTITTTYLGDGNFNGSAGSLIGSQVVSPADSSTAVVSLVNPSAYGQSITFTATVSDVSAGSTAVPTGAVQFIVDGVNLGSPITLTGASANSSTATSSATSTLSVAGSPHTVTASYVNADGNFNNSAGVVAGGQTITAASTATVAASSQNPSVFGQPVTFTATVTDTNTTAVPTGAVQFVVDGVNFGSPVTLVGASSSSSTAPSSATAALSIAGSPHAVAVSYMNADGNFANSSDSLSQVVSKAASAAVTQLAPPGPITAGASVQLTATVSAVAPGAGTPTGSVTFLDGATPLNTVVLSGGTASMTTSAWTIGSHSITSSYSGDGNFNGTTSPAAVLSVTPPSRTITANAVGNGTITPSTQYIVDGNTASFTVTPQNGYTAMMSTTCPEGLGTLTNNVYVTRAISQDCSVTATFASASATLALTLTDNRSFVHYGGFINYVVTLSNSSGNDATGLTISGAETSPSSDLDTANGHWQCFASAADCLPSGTGPFLDGNVTVPANSSVTWIVSLPKRPDPPDGLASYAVTVNGTTPALMQFDTDIFVIFRDGYDKANGDGAESVSPDSGVTVDWDGSALALSLGSTTSAIGVVQTVLEASAADHSGFRVEHFAAAQQDWLRVVTFARSREEQSTGWVSASRVASLWLGTTGTKEQREVILLGGAAELDVPIAASPSWKVRLAQPGK